MATFGNIVGDGYTYAVTAEVNYIRGWGGSPATNGTADSITIKTGAVVTVSHEIQCALYEYVSSTDIGNLIATTETKKVSATNTEYTFNFSDPKPTLIAGTNYYLLCGVPITVDGSYRTRLVCDITTGSLGTVTGTSDPVTWSDPMTGESFSASNLYIYCSYTSSTPAIYIYQSSFQQVDYYSNEQALSVDGWR